MALKKVDIVDKIEVLENGSVQVRTKTIIFEDNKQIGGSFHRHVVMPGDDFSKEDEKVKAVCSAVHTESVVKAHKASTAKVI